ncbi:MAG: hypothetical protein AAFV53_31195, partial [Myxococcota bacterium]
RLVARLAQEAVIRLRDQSVLDLAHDDVRDIVGEIRSRRASRTPIKAKDPVEEAFQSLNGRYDRDRVERPLSWYFSLGGKGGPRWTVRVDKNAVSVTTGRPPDGAADCVVKTSPEMMTRIIEKAYVPEVNEFMSGVIKTNEIPLLIEFSRVFGLSEVSP